MRKSKMKTIGDYAAQHPFSVEEIDTALSVLLSISSGHGVTPLTIVNNNTDSFAERKKAYRILETIGKKHYEAYTNGQPGILSDFDYDQICEIIGGSADRKKLRDLGVEASKAGRRMAEAMKTIGISINKNMNNTNQGNKMESMTPKEFIEFQRAFFDKNIEITKAKNADYTGQSGDAFANFTGVAVASCGYVNPLQGFITRMHDKFARISSFVKNGELLVKDEGVADTLADLANYCSLFAGYIESLLVRAPMTPDTFFGFQKSFYDGVVASTTANDDDAFSAILSIEEASSNALNAFQGKLYIMHLLLQGVSIRLKNHGLHEKASYIAKAMTELARECSLIAAMIENKKRAEEHKENSGYNGKQ